MLLYKYRSTEKFEYVKDILENKRLYAARLDEINDPMDGFLRFGIQRLFPNEPDLVREAKEILKMWRIVSMSQSRENELLWSYYADGFRGVAIGVVPTTMARKIKYYNEVVLFAEFAKLRGKDLAEGILLWKFEQWKHEQEWRIIVPIEQQYVDVQVREVVFGERIDPEIRSVITDLVRTHVPNASIREFRVTPQD